MIRSDIFKDEGSNNFWLNFFQRFSTFENIQTERKETPTSDPKCSTILTNLIDFNRIYYPQLFFSLCNKIYLLNA